MNPDLFEEVVIHYSLLDSFDAVITSSSQATDDKVELCWRALALLGVDDPGDTVLIDNLRVNIDGWVTAGGKGYLFVDDDAFADDVACGKVPGFEARDLGSEGIRPSRQLKRTDVCDRSHRNPPGVVGRGLPSALAWIWGTLAAPANGGRYA